MFIVAAITAGFRMQTDLVSPFNGSGLYADGGGSVRSGADEDDAVDIPAPECAEKPWHSVAVAVPRLKAIP